MLNEMRYARAWLTNVQRYADEIIVCDTGSMDGTREFMEANHVKLFTWRVKDRYVWPEAQIRNHFATLTTCEWICYQDADELVGQDFIDALPKLQKTRLPFVRFPQISFWYGLHTIRARSLKSWHDWKHFYPNGTKTKLYRKECTWGSGAEINGCHPYLQYKDWGRWSQRLCKYTNIPFFHYHYAFGMRLNDLEGYTMEGRFVPFRGKHPEEVELLSHTSGEVE
jgi:glycosyltransferase involved in cell wall biosynthesis